MRVPVGGCSRCPREQPRQHHRYDTYHTTAFLVYCDGRIQDYYCTKQIVQIFVLVVRRGSLGCWSRKARQLVELGKHHPQFVVLLLAFVFIVRHRLHLASLPLDDTTRSIAHSRSDHVYACTCMHTSFAVTHIANNDSNMNGRPMKKKVTPPWFIRTCRLGPGARCLLGKATTAIARTERIS